MLTKKFTKCLVTSIIFLVTLFCLCYFNINYINFVSGSSIPREASNITLSNLNSSALNVLKKNGTILLWTEVYFIYSNYLSCGDYNCELTKDRQQLQDSDIIVFNARFAKGKIIFKT